jgi:hypothetical protein
MKKKLAIALIASLASLTAFAQGKISFQTDSLHLVFWPGFPGQGVNSDNLPPGITGMSASLYMGTSSSQLFLYSSTTFGPLATGPGKWTSMQVQANANPTTGAPAIPGGTSVFIEAVVTSTDPGKTLPNTFDPAAIQSFNAWGYSSEFTFNLGSGLTYPIMYTSPTWPIGTWPLDQYGAGSRGAIFVVPEASVLALVALGAAAGFVFRRKSIS